MKNILFYLRAGLVLLALAACSAPEPLPPTPRPTAAPSVIPSLPAARTPTPTQAPSPTATAAAPPQAELDSLFYSGPQRKGDAQQVREQLRAPEAGLISLEPVEGEYLVEVAAAPGAVPPNARVVLVNMETLAFKLLTANELGGFRERLLGFPGAHILVKQDSTGGVAAFNSSEDMAGAEFLLAPGAILQQPFERREDGFIPIAGGFCCDHFAASWIFEGGIASDQLQPGEGFTWQGNVTLFFAGSEAPNPGTLAFYAIYLSDESGRQVGSTEEFIAALLTPSGLAIERTWGNQPLGPLVEVPLSWQKEGERWTASTGGEAQVPANFRQGRYMLFAALFSQGQQAQLFPPRPGERLKARCCNGDRLTVLQVGDPPPTRLSATLLADTLSEGARGGVIAREDAGLFAFSTRTVTHHNPVIARLDARGEPWTYQLGPYLPMVGGVDRTFPGLLPAVNFDLTSGSLSVRIQRPDGGEELLGPAPLTRLSSYTPTTPWFDNVSNGGGSLGEVPQLLGSGETFAYQFPANGDYVVTLDGQIKDLLGNGYLISGTYDVTIADIFDIETAAMPGTPFEVGDSLPVSLYVMPGLPAEVDYTITTYAANGEKQTGEYHGQANAFGWWDGDGQSHVFEQPGEYRVDVQARFAGGEQLWVGRMTFGGVVASPNPPIAMHGRRGPDGLDYLAPAWSFDTDYRDPGRDHFQLPYFSGDILWSTPFDEGPDQRPDFAASNAAIVRSSIQILDPSNRLVQEALDRVRTFGGYQEAVGFAELVRGSQIPLITAANPARGHVGIHPDEIDFWSYLYNTVERPGVRVREIVRGSDIQAEYWRFDDAYHLQSGNGPEGDLPGDFKFIYGGAVLRDDKSGEGEYAIYASGWVHTEYGDPLGGRVMPPFQGAAGGPSGGPLFTIFDQPVDIFFVPLALRPGMALELGDTFRLAGAVMPTLPSKVEYSVTAPDGTRRDFSGSANAVGYYYQPADDFPLDQIGEWRVELAVTHDGQTSAGPVEEPYPSGGPLTSDLRTFSFFVVASAAERLPVYTDLSTLDIQPWHYDVASASFGLALPAELQAGQVHLVATIPGIVLAAEELSVQDGRVLWRLDAPALNRLVHNLDYERGLADSITVTFFVQDGERAAAGSLVAHGWFVPLPPAPPQTSPFFSQPDGSTIVVASAADSGPGTLRQVLLEAQSGYTITFDPLVFPPQAPVAIHLDSGLPPLTQGGLTIDASRAGVILDGSGIPTSDPQQGLAISSDGNVIRGLQITGFSDAGIGLYGGAQHNLIGGERGIGAGPLRQGNLISGYGSFGIGLWDTAHNTIQGNYIGVNLDGKTTRGFARDAIHSNGATQNLITGNVIGGAQQAGVYLCCAAEGGNTLTDNWIGVSPAGNPLPNNVAGVLIDRTSRNVVGPGNTISHNNADGVAFWEDSLYNTVTQNSIYDNGGPGIGLYGRGSGPRSPSILDFDLQAGTVAGAACAGCKIEFFSDWGEQGAVYEGQALAGADGAFHFDKGAPFSIPRLTATATDGQGITSPFSPPTSGPEAENTLQTGKHRPVLDLEARCSNELANNLIGAFWGQVKSLEGWGDACAPQGIKGFTMVRLSFNEVEGLPAIDWSQPELEIAPEQEAFVSSLAESGLTLTYLLNFWDKANHPGGWQGSPARFTTEQDIRRYLEYVRFIVSRFKGRVRYYELWNEPDNQGRAVQYIAPQDYAELVRRAAPVIRAEDPAAKIVVGSVSNLLGESAREWLYALIRSDVMPLVDALAWHPLYGASPDYADERAYYYAYPGILKDIQETASAHGFRGEFRGDEIGWCSPDSNPNPNAALSCGTARHSHTDTAAAKYLARGILLHLGAGAAVHLGGMSVLRSETNAVVGNLATVLAGARAEAFPLQIQTTGRLVTSYTFVLPNGDRLAAVWTDGIAGQDDPGVSATLTFRGSAAQSVTGIDVLHGFEQQLVVEITGGSLVIRDFMIKDYPILLRLEE